MNFSDSKMSAALRARIRDLASGPEGGCGCVMDFDPGFTGFEGHFTGNPIVPGVCLIEAARVISEEVCQRNLRTVKIGQCRFRRPIRAGEKADVTLKIVRLPESGRWKVQADFQVERSSSAQMRLEAEES